LFRTITLALYKTPHTGDQTNKDGKQKDRSSRVTAGTHARTHAHAHTHTKHTHTLTHTHTNTHKHTHWNTGGTVSATFKAATLFMIYTRLVLDLSKLTTIVRFF
jgi:Ni/Co efflux regulator RcnB